VQDEAILQLVNKLAESRAYASELEQQNATLSSQIYILQQSQIMQSYAAGAVEASSITREPEFSGPTDDESGGSPVLQCDDDDDI
jgi:hypothetical protein